MKRVAVFFTIFIIIIVILADTGNLPRFVTTVVDGIPHGDRVGHFILFGLLNFFITRAALSAFPFRPSNLVALSAGLILALFVAAEEYSQNFFHMRTPDIVDLLAGYIGMLIGGIAAYKRHAVG